MDRLHRPLNSYVKLQMPLQQISASLTVSWLNHDSWTEAYVGSRRIAHEFLPESELLSSGDDGGLSKLALIGANQLMEIALYSLIKSHTLGMGAALTLDQTRLQEASYHDMLTKWLPAVAGKPLDLSVEPFLSTEKLRRRRNDTIHKTSAIATIAMARSAVYCAVEGSKSLYDHVGIQFPYEPFLKKYPLSSEDWFSSIRYPGEA